MGRPSGWLARRESTGFRRLGMELSRALLDCFCPPTCAGCGGTGDDMCRRCTADLQRVGSPACDRCGEPILTRDARCTGDHRPLAGLSRVRVPFRYAGTGGAVVRRLKFLRDPQAARLLCREMARAAGGLILGPSHRTVLVSVPLHRERLRQRGWDQAALLAEGLERALGILYVPKCLVRSRPTLPQGDPRVTSRDRNVEGAFVPRRTSAVRGRSVLLVDDVFTSGSTARECSRVLRAAGAVEVSLVAAARA